MLGKCISGTNDLTMVMDSAKAARRFLSVILISSLRLSGACFASAMT